MIKLFNLLLLLHYVEHWHTNPRGLAVTREMIMHRSERIGRNLSILITAGTTVKTAVIEDYSTPSD